MSAIRKLERDYLKADISEVDGLLQTLGDEDVMMRFSLEERLAELQEALTGLEGLLLKRSRQPRYSSEASRLQDRKALRVALPARRWVSFRTWFR